MQNIILYWMRWTWKSAIWKQLADSLWYNFIDLDKYIEEKNFHKGVKVGTNFKDNILSYNENGHINQAGTITFTKGDNTKEMVFTIGDGRYVIK